MVELVNGHFMRRTQRRLDQIVKWRIPGVDRYAHFHGNGDKMINDVPRIDQYCQR